MMSDLRESGSIESDADIVIFLYRDDYYNRDSERKNLVELIVAKGRNVGVGVVEMAFFKKTGRFANIDREHQPRGESNDQNRSGVRGGAGKNREGRYKD
jgi:replicative DNA helicase